MTVPYQIVATKRRLVDTDRNKRFAVCALLFYHWDRDLPASEQNSDGNPA